MNWIDAIILGLLDTYGTNDPYELCDSLEIDISKVERKNPVLFMEDSIYMRDYKGNESIFICDDLHISYEKFYLRHELGHAILHPDLKCSYYGGLIPNGKIERQANYFAYKLSDIKIDPHECEGSSINQLASYVEVPENVLWQVSEERGITYGTIF